MVKFKLFWQPLLWTTITFALLVSLCMAEFVPVVKQSKEDNIADGYAYFEDSATILGLRKDRLIISYDDGKTWTNVKETGSDTIATFSLDPYFRERAIAITTEKNQYVTYDKGKNWKKFNVLDLSKNPYKIDSVPKVLYNSKNINYVMLEFYSCPDDIFSENCRHIHFVSKDGFKSNPAELSAIDVNTCVFARSSLQQNENESIKDETILCTQNKLNSFGHIVESKLFRSDDFFNSNIDEVAHEISKSGSITDIRIVANFIVLVVRNDKFSKKSGVSFVVSRDAKKFEVSDLSIKVVYGEMQLLESSPLSIFVVITDYNNRDEDISLSTIYSSDSTGLRFTKRQEFVMSKSILKIQNIDGSWIILVAEDPNKGDDTDDKPSIIDFFLGDGYKKNVRSLITIDDGKTWNPLIVDDCDGHEECSLHLLSPTERDGEGKFVTGPTPGILFGVGNVGEHIDDDVTKLHTWYSRDGGVSWKFALHEPCIFAFGDLGNIIMAIPYYEKDYSLTDYYYYSVNQGKSWVKVVINHSIYPLTLTTTIDGTSTQFLLTGLVDKTPENGEDFDFNEIIYSIDFSKAFNGKVCSTKNVDFEPVYARINQNGEPNCVYGHKEKFWRRKQDNECFVNNLYEDLKIESEACECTKDDYECDIYFRFDSEKKECVIDSKAVASLCSQETKGTVFTTFDLRKIQSNLCVSGKEEIPKRYEIKCDDYADGGNEDSDGNKSSEIVSVLNTFSGEMSQYSYFEEGDSFGGENVIIKLGKDIWASNDGGVKFVLIDLHEECTGYITGYVPGHVILLTDTKYFYISVDGVNFLRRHEAPSLPSALGPSVVSFHRTDTDKFIWYSSENCINKYSSDCEIVAYHTTDGGKTFEELKRNVQVCDYISPNLEDVKSEFNNTIYCSTIDKSSLKKQLVSTHNDFKDQREIFDHVVGYAITGKFVLAATVETESESLKAKVTVDGETFADAKFPKDIQVNAQQAYTVLDSITKSIFLHVTTHNVDGHEFGAILKSNSNGTSYVLSLNYVNRNRIGYVDYDRIDGLEGTILANTVENYKNVVDKNDAKLLKTQISHNDGAEWSYLLPPAVNVRGEKYPCLGSSLAKCSLNLHGFTERADYRDTYSSSSATGLLIGVGSVGEYLEHYSQSSTFLSRDGGITWKEIMDGVNMWEYGDRGTILVLVNGKDETDKINYSLDEGETWKEYKFADEPIKVLDLATAPSDSSRKFIVFGSKRSDRHHTLSYSIDFTNVHQRQCQLDLDNPEKNDYEYWTPKHPNLPDNCLFGHEAKYLRRAVGHNDCFIGSAPLKDGFKTVRNCLCTRRDFECDYNFFRASDETCHLVGGLTPADRQKDSCEIEGAFQYFESTGYRKIPLSTCEGGKKYASWDVHPCPGKEKEFNKYYGNEISGMKWFLVVGIPIFVFLFSAWFVYERGIRRNGGFKRLGQIRLDLEDDDGGFHPIEENNVDIVVNKIVSGGIFVVAATIATFKTLRKIDRMMFDKLVAQIFRRSRSGQQRSYVLVPSDIQADEEELFRDDYEEELNEDGIQINTNPFHDDTTNFGEEDDITNFHDEDRDARDVDSRLFNIDDQSDEERP